MPVTGTRSRELAAAAREHMPGGVNSPVRAFGAVGGEPLLFASGRGCRLVDVDGREYIDLVGSWGALILGHAHPRVVEAVERAARRGLSFGATHEAEIELAREIKARFPSIDLVRLVNSGTEAAMSAVRVARGFTGRSRVVKFEGCYHGHSDGLLARAGSGAMTFGLPDSAGVPRETTRPTAVLPYNDLEAVEEFLERHGEEVAAVILEPVAANMGVVPPVPGFLEGLRKLCDEYGVVLIFDEVVTGLRLAPGGAQERWEVQADLTCLGKILGGGLPLAAYGGRREIMEQVAPLGPVYQAGTLAGNPLAVAAGLETLRVLGEDPDIYRRLEEAGAFLADRLRESVRRRGVAAVVQQAGSMLTLFFRPHPVRDGAEAREADTRAFAAFFQAMRESGVYLPPSPFEALFLGAAHTQEDLERVAQAADRALGCR